MGARWKLLDQSGDRLHSRRFRPPELDGLRCGGHALLPQGNNSASDMRGQLVGLRFAPSFG